jgi:hypothetical protein
MAGPVVKGLGQTATKRRLIGPKARTIREVCDYLYRNRERMRYDEYLRNGCRSRRAPSREPGKNLIRDRFERSGMRRTPEIAEALRRVRATHLSGRLQRLRGASHRARSATPISPGPLATRPVVRK